VSLTQGYGKVVQAGLLSWAAGCFSLD
jgi:hypothetical protein